MNREIQLLRDVITKLVPLLTGKNLKVTQRGSQAYVQANPRTNKPEVVNIPSIPDNATSDFIAAVSGFIDHEVAHVLFTDWAAYGGDGVAINKFSAEGQALVNTHNIIEDTFIEREIVKVFPGSEGNLDRLHRHFLEKITTPALVSANGDKNTEFAYLVVPMMRALSGQELFQEFMDKNDYWKHPLIENLLMAMSDEGLELIKTAKSTSDTFEVAQEIHDILFHNRKKDGTPAQKPQPQPKPKSQPKPPEQKGQSQDKPEKQAGQGDGDGERKHDEDGEESEDDSEGEAQGASSGAASEEDEDSEEADASSGQGDDDAEDEQDGEAEDDGQAGESDDEEQSDDADEDGDGEGDEESEGEGAGDGDDEQDGDGEGDEAEEDGDDIAGNEDVSERSGNSDSNGAGGDTSTSMFDLDPADFKPLDLSSAISQQIQQMAKKAIGEAPYSVFTKDEDEIKVLQVPDNAVKDDWVPKLDEAVSSMVGPMQKDIERLMAAQSLAVRTAGHKSGRLHSASLYRVLQGDPRVFQRKEEHTSKDTAVMLLVDNSGSMQGGRIVVAMQAAYALAQTLERVGIPSEIIGFTTGALSSSSRQQAYDEYSKHGIRFSRDCSTIVMPIFKTFNERLNGTVKKRIAYQLNAQVGMNTNTDGESLEYAAQRLIPRRERRKVMLVLSDGQPVGEGTSTHLKATVKSLTKMGVETVGIGIQTDAVKNYYPRHMTLNNLQELPAAVMGELKRILTT
jgi:nitric oxide reductase activation protein